MEIKTIKLNLIVWCFHFKVLVLNNSYYRYCVLNLKNIIYSVFFHYVSASINDAVLGKSIFVDIRNVICMLHTMRHFSVFCYCIISLHYLYKLLNILRLLINKVV